jgi:hypothetical protein
MQGRRRVVSYDHAINSGMLAGRNMVASRWAGLGAERGTWRMQL